MPIASRPSITWPRERWAWVSMALGAGILWFNCQWLYFGRYRYAVDGREYEDDRFR